MRLSWPRAGDAMTSETWGRIGIVASIVGAVGAIAYLLKSGQLPQIVVTGVSSGGQGTGGVDTGGTVGNGVSGPAGAPGQAGAAGAPGAPGAAGAGGAQGAPGPTGPFPSASDIAAAFNAMFQAPQNGSPVSSIWSNIPPRLDPARAAGTIAMPASDGGCGCGGGGGCGGCGQSPKCPNLQPPLRFVDGRGGCAASTTTSLVASMDRCRPGGQQTALYNMQGNFAYMGYADFDPSLMAQDVINLRAAAPQLTDGEPIVGLSQFGGF